jgi:hypothetical protein
LAEAVAIVYSPIEEAQYKAFRIKNSRIAEIQKCKMSGFHEHKDAYGLFAFEECRHLEYVNGRANNIITNVVDLR